MATNIAIDQATLRPYVAAGADDATLVEGPGGRASIMLGSVGVPADHNTVERSVDQGSTWEPVADTVPLGGSVADPECLSAGPTLYRVSAVSATPSVASATTEFDPRDYAMWLNGGANFSTSAQLMYTPGRTVSTGVADQELVYFSGRTLPVALEGDATTLIINASARVLPARVDPEGGDTITVGATLKALSHGGRVLYRDPLGRRVYGALSGVQVKEEVDGTGEVAFTLTETEDL